MSFAVVVAMSRCLHLLVAVPLRLADTMNVGPEHAFGVTVFPDELCKFVRYTQGALK